MLGYKEPKGFNGLVEGTVSEVDALTSCPKCGFEQPVDTYCAKCGIDMTTLPKKPTSIAKQPAIIGGIAVFAVIVTFAGVRAMRSGSEAPTSPARSSAALASEVSEISNKNSEQRRDRLSAQANSQIQQNIADQSAVQAIAADMAPAEDVHFHASHENAAPNHQVPGSATPNTATGVAAGPSAGAKALAGAKRGDKVDASKSVDDSLIVAFAWTEVSREWLQAMGAIEPGLHRIPDLETRLRESQGQYRILDVQRHRLSDGMTNVSMTRGDRLAFRFDLANVTANSFSGSVQSTVRAADGAMRAPASAAMTIEKGYGSIMTISGPGTGLGPNPTGAEIVVLILPRWGADRNP